MILASIGRQPGQWRPVINEKQISAIYYCQLCGKPMSLLAHQIKEDGTVNPSVVCPRSSIPLAPTVVCEHCKFHNYIKLLDWKFHCVSH